MLILASQVHIWLHIINNIFKNFNKIVKIKLIKYFKIFIMHPKLLKLEGVNIGLIFLSLYYIFLNTSLLYTNTNKTTANKKQKIVTTNKKQNKLEQLLLSSFNIYALFYISQYTYNLSTCVNF